METRKIDNIQIDQRTVEGYACMFNSPSVDMGFVEVIHTGAITQDTIDNSDVFAKLNHCDDKILARSKNGKGSLLLEVDDKGLHYMFEAPHTALGNEVLEYLNRGDITSSSFAFSVDKNDLNAERWYKKDGIIYRDIYKIKKLYDVSPVFEPAYEATTCSARYSEIKMQSDEVDNIMNIYTNEITQL